MPAASVSGTTRAAEAGDRVGLGEAESAKSFGDYVREKTGWDVSGPEFKDEIILD